MMKPKNKISQKQIEDLLETLIAMKWHLFATGKHADIEILDENIKLVEQLQIKLMTSIEKIIS